MATKRVSDTADSKTTVGLLGVNNSLAYRVHEIEKHFHSSEQVFGNNSGFMAADEPVKFTVVGGDDAWGTELHIHGGDVIESGSSTMKFDLNTLYIVSLDAANKISVVEFLTATVGNAITGTVVETTEVYTRTGGDPMVEDNDKVIVTAATGITGVVSYEVYYVTDVAGSTFKLSKTIGGTSVALGGDDGTFGIKKLTQTSLTKCFVSAASVNTDASPLIMRAPRRTCDIHITVRAKSESEQTVSIGFLLGLHTYVG